MKEEGGGEGVEGTGEASAERVEGGGWRRRVAWWGNRKGAYMWPDLHRSDEKKERRQAGRRRGTLTHTHTHRCTLSAVASFAPHPRGGGVSHSVQQR